MINQLDVITNYINFFINNYDTDNELVTAYLKIKFSLDKKKEFTEDNVDAYIDFIYEVMFTDSMVEKIRRIVEENYLDDIESDEDDKAKYVKNEKKHLESLEFTNQHIKILLMISFSMKIMSPVIFHFTQINSIKLDKDSDLIFRFYQRLFFEIFKYGENYEKYDKNDNLVEENITEDEFIKRIESENLVKLKTGYEVRWVPTEAEYYYTHTQINMYNKLYVYVKLSFGVEKLVTAYSKTYLIAGTSY